LSSGRREVLNTGQFGGEKMEERNASLSGVTSRREGGKKFFGADFDTKRF